MNQVAIDAACRFGITDAGMEETKISIDLRLSAIAQTVLEVAADVEGSSVELIIKNLVDEFVTSRLNTARALLSRNKSASRDLVGEVYFIRRGTSGPIKIGKSIDAQRRVKTLSTGNDRNLTLLFSVPNVGDTSERALHSRFSHLRMRGEWFKASPELLGFINSLAAESKTPE